jgi:NAD(P)-dependent dehydrogenase (short-subunit alcohol dehydrogenase family)
MLVAVVTGAGSGMGRACVGRVRPFVDVVVACDLEAPQIDGVVGVACDVADPEAVRALGETVAATGSCRALIHAAGISPTQGDARRVLEVDLIGTQLMLDVFDDRVGPGFAGVCFSSSAAYVVAPFLTPEMETLLRHPLDPEFLDRAVHLTGGDSGFAYALAKVGVIRAAARAAVTWGPRGARVNSLAPGLIDTPMGRRELERQPAMRQMLSETPAGRMGRADEVAAVAAFLVSDEASFVSGIDVLVDGGQQQGSKASAP